MLINDDEKGTGRFGRLVPSGFPWSKKRTSIERLRRWTFWSLTVGIPLAWTGGLSGIAEGRQGDQESALTLVFGLLGLVVFSVLYMRMVKAAVAGTTANREIVASGVLTVVLLLTQETHLWGWGLLAPSWAVGAALLLNRTGTLVVSVGAVAAGLLLASFDAVPVLGRAMVAPYTADDSALTGAFIGFALVLPGTNRFQLWFWKIVKSAEEGKEAQARLAVTEERLRFSRDLHDLVGHSLSAIAVKSEVAVKLSKVDTGRAVAEMDEVRGLARQALKEIRTAVRGYRTVDLDAELRSMTAVLEAAGIRCTLDTPEERLPEESATLLAWVVREGTTNVLRHSSATRCRIVVALRDGTAVLEMTNDGMTEAGGRGGTGLVGLSERLAATGGRVTAGAGGAGEFRLRATVPLEGM